MPATVGGHFQIKSEAGSLPVYWSGPPTCADVLHLAFVLHNVIGSLDCFQRRRRLPVAIYRTLADLIEAARARPGDLTLASFGHASPEQMTFEMFKRTSSPRHHL